MTSSTHHEWAKIKLSKCISNVEHLYYSKHNPTSIPRQVGVYVKIAEAICGLKISVSQQSVSVSLLCWFWERYVACLETPALPRVSSIKGREQER